MVETGRETVSCSAKVYAGFGLEGLPVAPGSSTSRRSEVLDGCDGLECAIERFIIVIL